MALASYFVDYCSPTRRPSVCSLAERRSPPSFPRCTRGGSVRKDGLVNDYLPEIYVSVRQRFPDVARALDGLGQATDRAGPLDERTQRLVKLAVAIASESPGAVRSNVRKALDAGDTVDEIRHVAVLAITTCGFPTAVAGLHWIDEVLDAGEST
jgi:alkylhydroperoxidase/carboxymuconolactone decarboxylase family protein YurZ